MTNPRRRMFRYSLRTIFVLIGLLSMPLAWIAWSLSWMHQRDLLRQQEVAIIETALQEGLNGDAYSFSLTCDRKTAAPLALRLFGAEGVGAFVVIVSSSDSIRFSAQDRERLAKVRQLFPESTVIPLGWDNAWKARIR